MPEKVLKEQSSGKLKLQENKIEHTKMAEIKKTDNTSSERMKHLELSCITGGTAKWCNHFRTGCFL